jgi:predicted DNA-binding antitoxin AbrB/MazE fold protein
MTQHIRAIYDNGVLRPLEAIDLADQEVISISIASAENEGETAETGPSLYDAFHEAGLIGCVNDAPADLSTNPKHMEGFGSSGGSPWPSLHFTCMSASVTISTLNPVGNARSLVSRWLAP